MTLRSRILVLLTSVWFIAAAAFVARLAFAYDQQGKIPHQVLATVPFDQEAGNIALALSQENGFSNLFRQSTGPTAWLAPAYPFLLSKIFSLFGPFTISSFFAAVFLNIIFSSAVVFPLFHLARRVAGPAIAAASAWMWALLPAAIIMPFEWVWDTSLSALLATTILYLTLRISDSSKLWLWLTYAILWAVAILTNPSLAIALPFLFFWAAVRARDVARISWRAPVLSLSLIILCCSPWTIRNYRVFDRFIPIRSSLPFELWIGNNDIFDEHAVGRIQRITRFEETRRYAQIGENAYLAEKLQLASSFIRRKPALFLRLIGRKIIATWAGTELPFQDFHRADSLLVRVVIFCNLLLTAGTFFGIFLLARAKNPFTFPIAIFPMLFPLVYYVTHTSLRYRHPIDPMLVFLTAVALSKCFSYRPRVFFPTSTFLKTI
jgi:hypothetical protein